MKIIDLHQDLLLHIRFRDSIGQQRQTDFEMLEASDVDTVVATAFPFPSDNDQANPIVNHLISEEVEMYVAHCEKHPQWSLVKQATDLEKSTKKMIIHIEGLNAIEDNSAGWRQLDLWHQSGVRSMGTHWNISNSLGGGTLDPETGLSDFGKEVIQWVESKNMMLDCAHMGRQTFMDAAKITNRPLYVSHGNAAAVCPDVRNYTDEQLRLIAKTDGVIGVFFAGSFVAGRSRESVLDDVLAHITHIKKEVGIRHIAIGSDFGGILSRSVTELSSVADVENLFNALRTRGLTDEEVFAVSFQNASRILNSHLN